MHPDCPFCLANGKLQGTILAQTDRGFLTEALNFPGCYLIIPKRHTEVLSGLDDAWWSDFKQLFGHVEKKIGSYNLSLNVGQAAGQTVPHLHFWIVPRAGGEPASGKGLATLVRACNQAPEVLH